MHFLRRHFRQHSWWRLVWWLPTVVMVGYTLILAGLHTFAPADVVWLKVYMALFAFTSGPKLFFAVFSLAGYLIKKIFHTTYNYGNVLGIFVAISVVVSYFYACVYGIRQFVVNSTGAGMSANSFCWFCHAVPKLPLRWAYFLRPG